MRFILASLYRAECRAQITAAGLPLDAAPDVLDLECSRCGVVYVADLSFEDDPWDLEALDWEAVVRLEAEYPDHPHQFVVGGQDFLHRT